MKTDPGAIAIVNARIWTGDPRRPWADGLLADGSRLALVGSSAEVRKAAKRDTRVIDAAGKFVVPGFNDAHVHFIEGGFRLASVQLRDARTPEEVTARIQADAATAPPELMDRALDAAMRYVAAQGVTSVHNMGSWSDLATFERAHAAGRLRTRIYAAVPLASWERLRDHVAARGRGDEWLRIGGLKGFADGSLGSHTALMLEPFTDAPADRGLAVTPPEVMEAWVRGADTAGLHVIVHAIGDRAIRAQLDLYERVAREHGPRDRRFRIEHARHIAPAELSRFGRLGVVASMQPYRAIDDGRWAERVIGAERAKGTYAFRSLLDHGAPLAFGSDWFVAPPTPLAGIYAAVTRRTLDELRPDGWVPGEKITVDEALRAYTQGSAYAEFAEADKGMLRRGMLADFVMLDRDLTRIPPESIRDAQVLLTVVGGVVAFERESADATSTH
jgi:predicted amidohydrolase YtcJ